MNPIQINVEITNLDKYQVSPKELIEAINVLHNAVRFSTLPELTNGDEVAAAFSNSERIDLFKVESVKYDKTEVKVCFTYNTSAS